MQIEFINHASVLIGDGTTAILTDPWYSGPAFHKGWRLLVETPDAEVDALLDRVTHIWLSHEHPDHFSIKFFKTFGPKLIAHGIPVLFQQIKDQRVAAFLRGEGITLIEMPFGQKVPVGALELTCYKDDWYDSLVSIKSADMHILNLNDCHVDTEARAKEILTRAGPCDVLLTQFSYAAWKGGPENKAWREEAAAAKLGNMAVQAELLQPKTVIPFASYVRFANARNAYLNDAANTPQDVLDRFPDAPFDIAVMQPGDIWNGTADAARTEAALAYWRAAATTAAEAPPMTFDTKTPDEIRAAFDACMARVRGANSVWAMKLAQKVSPVRLFQPVVVECDDLDARFRIDMAQGTLTPSHEAPHLTMHSESLWFLFQNSFGFDTLTVNGCLEEAQPGGFSRAAKALGIETLNNLGFRFGPGLVFEPRLIAVTLSRLFAASKKLAKAA